MQAERISQELAVVLSCDLPDHVPSQLLVILASPLQLSLSDGADAFLTRPFFLELLKLLALFLPQCAEGSLCRDGLHPVQDRGQTLIVRGNLQLET